MRNILLILLCLYAPCSVFAAAKPAAKTATISGKISSGKSLLLLFSDGTSQVATLKSGKFSFTKVAIKSLKGASLQLIESNGRYTGPVLLGVTKSKGSVTFSGKLPQNSSAIKLGTLLVDTTFAKVKNLDKKLFAKGTITLDSSGRPPGALSNGLGRVSALPKKISVQAANSSATDTDGDSVPNAFDPDDDGDGVLDIADPESAASTASENPFTTLSLDFRRSINHLIRGGLSEAVIDEVISAGNNFNLIFFFPLEPGSNLTGAHVVCGSGLSYCRQGDGTALYTGVSESSDAFRNQPWINLNQNGSGFPNLELVSFAGGSFSALVAGIEPRVGGTDFRANDIYRIVFTGPSGEVSNRVLTLSPYFISVPVILNYNAGAGTTSVDYSAITPTSGSIPGVSQSDPIVLGASGIFQATIYRPQRSSASGSRATFSEMQNLNYGIVLSTSSSEFTCGGLYSNLSAAFTQDSDPLGIGGAASSQSGANLFPLRDALPADSDQFSDPLSLTVDLKACLARAGGSPGVYQLALTAAGEELSGGRNRATQLFFVQIP